MNSLSREDANMLKLLTLRLEHSQAQNHETLCMIAVIRNYERGSERGVYECLFEAELAAERCVSADVSIINFIHKAWP